MCIMHDANFLFLPIPCHENYDLAVTKSEYIQKGQVMTKWS